LSVVENKFCNSIDRGPVVIQHQQSLMLPCIISNLYLKLVRMLLWWL